MHARLPRAWLSWVARGAGGAAGSGLPWRSWLPFEVHRQQRRHVCGERRPQSFTGGSGGLRTREAMGFRCLQPAAPSFCSDHPPPQAACGAKGSHCQCWGWKKTSAGQQLTFILQRAHGCAEQEPPPQPGRCKPALLQKWFYLNVVTVASWATTSADLRPDLGQSPRH